MRLTRLTRQLHGKSLRRRSLRGFYWTKAMILFKKYLFLDLYKLLEFQISNK